MASFPKALKRLLYLAHRWTGIVLCLFMLMWFVSGVVMMYVGYPKLTESERLAHLPALPMAGCCVAADSLGATPAGGLRLFAPAGKPIYAVSSRGRVQAFDARSGAPIDGVAQADAAQSAQAFLPGYSAIEVVSIQEDRWTHTRGLDAHRPLYRARMNDSAGTLLYVSSRTGEVVRDADRIERGWNYVGAWLHWLYPLRGGWLDTIWNPVVVALSTAACLLAMAGIVLGIWRWRFAGRYKTGRKTPYRNAMMRWHHLAGLAFGAVVLTWSFSGLMSMNPWEVFRSQGPAPDRVAYATGGRETRLGLPPAAAAADAAREAGLDGVREIRWLAVAGQPYAVAVDAAGHTRIVQDGADGAFRRWKPSELSAAAATVLAASKVSRQKVLNRFDAYYYGRDAHAMLGGVDKRLPVLRVKFDDARKTWVHIDLHTGEIVSVMDRSQRVKRWLFAFLHSWDWPALLAARPWWDILLIVLSLGGALVSASGAVIGWRRLRHKLMG